MEDGVVTNADADGGTARITLDDDNNNNSDDDDDAAAKTIRKKCPLVPFRVPTVTPRTTHLYNIGQALTPTICPEQTKTS